VKLNLENACSKYGAQMGRPDRMPEDKAAPVKLQLQKLRLVDGDYDRGGAYWGYTKGTSIYCAFAENVQMFTRSANREEAKQNIRAKLPAARFYR